MVYIVLAKIMLLWTYWANNLAQINTRINKEELSRARCVYSVIVQQQQTMYTSVRTI